MFVLVKTAESAPVSHPHQMGVGFGTSTDRWWVGFDTNTRRSSWHADPGLRLVSKDSIYLL